jgi:hypothetical protein
MLKHTLTGPGKDAPRKEISRAAALLAVGALAFALGGCSLYHRTFGSETGAEVKNPPGAHDPYPKLGSVPDRPKDTESADSRREVARALAADRDAAHYTDQALRGGTQASAPPPPAPVAEMMGAPATGSVDDADKTKSAAAADDKPSFFGRLFHHSKPKPAEATPGAGDTTGTPSR